FREVPMKSTVVQWWGDRALREQVLIAGLAALMFLFAVYQFVLKPVSDYKAAASVSYETAAAFLAAVESSAYEIRAMGGADKPSADGDAQTMRANISATARELGLSITRLQPVPDGQLDIWFDGVGSGDLFNWVNVLNQ